MADYGSFQVDHTDLLDPDEPYVPLLHWEPDDDVEKSDLIVHVDGQDRIASETYTAYQSLVLGDVSGVFKATITVYTTWSKASGNWLLVAIEEITNLECVADCVFHGV